MESLEIQRVRGTNDFVPPDEARLRHLADTLRGVFELYGYQGIETPLIENLDLFLRKSGEEIAARMYSFTHWNRQLCLRPEYTASVMRAYVNHLQDRPLPLRLFYAGPTFRYEKPQRGRYRQFTEVGVECIGGAGPAADAEALRLAARALARVGIQRCRLVLGHLGVVLQLLRQLGIDEHGQALVLANMEPLARRRADREAIVERILSLVARPSVEEDAEPFTSDDDGRSLSGLLSEFGPEGAARVTADLLQRASLSLEAGTRTPEEIVERLLSKASRADPSDQVRAAAEFIVQLNDLAGPPSSALPALAELLRQHNLDPTPLQELSQALELLDTGPKSNVPSPKSDLGLGTWDPSASSGQALGLDVQVDLSLGRGLRYYTGLVFEIYQDGPDGALQLCGGGRYDDLVRALGGRESVPACGFSFGLERLDLALGERSDDGCARGADLLLAPLEQADMADAVQLSETLRDAGIRVELDIKLRGAKASLRHADRAGIPVVALLGQRERESGQVLLRRMASRQESAIPLADLVTAVQAAVQPSQPS